MLRIGKMTDYAVLILSQMAKTPDSLRSAKSLADALYLTTPTVSKIMKMLAEARLVSSVRGAEGGYRLSKAAIEISVADIIAAMEGSLALTECCNGQNACILVPKCMVRDNWKKINKMVHSMLSKLTIQDMLQPLPEVTQWQMS